MIAEKLRIFKLLLYKNFLVRKSYWKMGLFVEIAIPLLIFVSVWGIRNLITKPPVQFNSSYIYPIENKHTFFPSYGTKIYVVPDNPFITSYMEKVQNCLGSNHYSFRQFKTIEDMYLLMDYSYHENVKESIISVVFKNNSIDSSTTRLDYKILVADNVPDAIYQNMIPESRRIFYNGFVGLQLCLDESFIKLKGKHDLIKIHIDMQKLPIPPHVEQDVADDIFRTIFCTIAVLIFLWPLCAETSYASEEKFLGINVLMAMNGVPNCLNLLSWLFTGLVFSSTYIIPIVVLVNFTTNDNAIPFLYYGNSFLFWLILTVHFVHLVTFGMHMSAYFTRSLFMITGILVIYIGSTIMANYGLKNDNLKFVPYLGIIFPNILLFRACQEINYYESIMKGIQFSNMFGVGLPQYKTAGSVGMILILSIFGSIFHFIMANYIYAINPGKYGVKRNPFYFLKFFKRSGNLYNDPESEHLECNSTTGELFETLSQNVYTPGIQMRNLKKGYSTGLFSKEKVHALKGISVDFYQKQITALLGHNGAGKTTMMSILAGMISPSEGIVLINGKNVKNDADEIMNDMGLCPQENMYFPSLSIVEQLKFFAMLKNKNKSSSMVEGQVISFIHKLKLFEKRNSLPKELSGGQKRRVCLGMALVGDPSTVILDEPTSGLDPESRRDIWELLLKMRGEKTILISTHDMEEADILGDRIAIVHSGTLRSYGTSMFLKKLLGQGNVEVTLSTESWCDSTKIRSHLGSESQIISTDGSKIQLSIPNSPGLPDLLDKLESSKRDLGITGMSVSLITLERVFLKVTQDDTDNNRSLEAFIDTTEKLKGRDLFLHSAMGLLRKKMIYTIKNASTPIIMLVMLLIPMFCIGNILMDHYSGNDDLEPMPINLNMYNGGSTIYRANGKAYTFGKIYETVTQEAYGNAMEDIDGNSNFIDDLIQLGIKDLANYNYNLIAAAKFTNINNKLNVTALYNYPKAIYSLPVSINLITNTLLKTFTNSDYSISIEIQQFSQKFDISKYTDLMFTGEKVEQYLIPIIFVCFFYPLVALFVIHPLREASTNIKHLQRMTGASFFGYWGTMFFFDFVVMMILTALVVIGFAVFNAVLGLHMMRICEFLILTLLFILFTLNVLPLIYIITFWNKNTSSAIKLLSLLPLGLIVVDMIIYVIKLALNDSSKTMNIIRPIQEILFLMTPYVSFFYGLIAFFRGTRHYGNCIRISKMVDKINVYSFCSDLKCVNGTCQKPPILFTDFNEDIALERSILSLCLSPILYFGLLYILEHKLIQRLLVQIFYNKPNQIDQIFEEQVRQVKHDVGFEVSKIKNKEQAPLFRTESKQDRDDDKKHIFLAYELRKLYGRFIAVQDISFGVRQGECFGLLGVNGAGKSTTFKMVTGEELPHNGAMYLNHTDMTKYRDYYLSQMGYCPQNDAIIRSLNAYDHLRLFARLRGIPESQVETEVIKWINRLNLNICASQPSGTYSGGNKRRLNIAIALIGIPNLVLLDEPTTGVDPAARRSLWNIIQSCQMTGQAVILTSHSMEECEALCNRLAIMVDGKFECIGASQELKQRFGAGYNIQLKLNPEISQNEISYIKQDMENTFDCEVMDENSGYLMYHLKSMELTWRHMYDVVNSIKNKYSSIEDFSVLSSTLEQLFLVFARSANKFERKI